jgi:hypothetical protein
VPGGMSVENIYFLLLNKHSSHLSEEPIFLARSMGLKWLVYPS